MKNNITTDLSPFIIRQDEEYSILVLSSSYDQKAFIEIFNIENLGHQKIADLKKRTQIILRDFNITAKHASILIASLLKVEAKK